MYKYVHAYHTAESFLNDWAYMESEAKALKQAANLGDFSRQNVHSKMRHSTSTTTNVRSSYGSRDPDLSMKIRQKQLADKRQKRILEKREKQRINQRAGVSTRPQTARVSSTSTVSNTGGNNGGNGGKKVQKNPVKIIKKSTVRKNLKNHGKYLNERITETEQNSMLVVNGGVGNGNSKAATEEEYVDMSIEGGTIYTYYLSYMHIYIPNKPSLLS